DTSPHHAFPTRRSSDLYTDPGGTAPVWRGLPGGMSRLQPVILFKDEQGDHRGEHHGAYGKEIAIAPAQLGHKIKVHSVHTGDQRSEEHTSELQSRENLV